ncbi:maturation of 16S RNA and assembly of 30S ribosomal subunit GTPase [Kyrpidia spormannii]|uniref:Maturation of 16S RNA and assembly of 30S ribosomal subunit GTPase n=2 Tax=Kyrpidia spormannii TaxID=2055160 RepID=A0ACA8Z7N3_9BACL|nr:maturation of 16S RNA and assembly of 30S ribosomal subunit GTPase [Kyrpidia spormannii]CAB3392129.1 maturation of 16S RNA and assembly of 30S ribosomal subunit GTPase [Kyrpidia spormannii]
MVDSSGFRSGFAALVGRPNVGKSTLLNRLIGTKIAIMSDKPQTTRNRIRGVLTRENGQVIFLDTPGVHRPKHRLGDYMTRLALATLQEVDLVLFVIDVTSKFGPGEQVILDHLQGVETPVFLVINKIDLVSPGELLPMIDEHRKRYPFREVVPVSAVKGTNLDRLEERIFATLPEGPPYYPADQVTDHPESFIVAELVREQVLNLTREEVPHSVAVTVEEMTPRENGLLYIRAVVVTEKESQKAILIGREGGMLRRVGQRARREIEALLGSRVYLDLWVKVKKDWRNREPILRNFGYVED